MRKTMIFAAVAALISFASCQKEGLIESGGSKNASPVFTASIAGATKTTVNVSDGKVAWELTDEITVADASSQSAVYVVESIDATTGKATFAMKDGETALGNGPYTATYGAAPATAQTYSETAGKLYMTAPATSDNSFTFTVQCGLMKLNLTKAGESVKSISVTGTPEGGSETTYTLTCTEAQSIAAEKDFFIALPEGTYTKIVITNSSNKVCTLNSAAGVAVAANHIKPVTFGEGKLNFVAIKGTAKRTGGIDVNWVQLWKNGPKFAEYNVGATSATELGGYYCWGKSENKDPNGYYRGGDNTLTGIDDTAINLWGSKWRMPTQAELESLISSTNCTVKWTANYNNSGTAGKIFTGKGDYESNSVFLPAAGLYYYGKVNALGSYGYYWSSTPNGSNNACYMYFFSGNQYADYFYLRDYSYSIRAVLAE